MRKMITALIKATHSNTEMRDIAARICRDYLSGAWKTISADEIQLKRISGGLSNFLYYVSLPDGKTVENDNLLSGSPPRTSFNNYSKRPRKDSFQNLLEPKEVLLRIYGQVHGESALETMLTESVVFTLLSERKLGPKLHGVFPGGRIEEFIPARALLTSELSNKKISMKIAERMSQIHWLDIPVSKEPEWMFKTMNRWLRSVQTIFNEKSDDKSNEFEEKLRKVNFKEEVEWLQSYIEAQNFTVAFSHNDLQEGNILYREKLSPSNSVGSFDDSSQLDSGFCSSDLISSNVRHNSLSNDSVASLSSLGNDSSPKSSSPVLLDNEDSALEDTTECSNESDSDPELMFIDFEYCAYNYRAFDLANHFLEWTFDYTNDKYPFFHHRKDQYPTIEQKDEFITTYLRKFALDEQEPTEEEKQELLDEVECLTLASHLFWGLWGIVNVHQEIEFGYWDYAHCRISEYFVAKKNYLAMKPNTGNFSKSLDFDK